MQGILKNDRFLEGIFNKLRGFITTQIQGDINYLWQIGISTSSSLGTGGYENMVKGQLEVDEDQLREALTNNPEAVWEFFGGNCHGTSCRPASSSECLVEPSYSAKLNLRLFLNQCY